MAYDGNDRFRNWGIEEYESKIIRLEAYNQFLKSRVITLKEQKAVLTQRLSMRMTQIRAWL